MRQATLAGLGMVMAVFAAGTCPTRAADPPASAAAPAPPAASEAGVPEVPPAKPGVYSEQKRNATRYHLSVTGHTFTSRDAVEKYLLYRAADLTMRQHYAWFTLVEGRAKGDTVPVPKPDPAGPRYSYRLEFFRPVWRYKTGAAAAWKNWSPFSGAAFFAGGMDPKGVAQFEVSADIVLHKGMVADDNPLAFDARAVSDFLVNQVSPPS